jgi:hypothetical protein
MDLVVEEVEQVDLVVVGEEEGGEEEEEVRQELQN